MSKLYHIAQLISDNGDVSTYCYKRAHPIDLKNASWVLEYNRSNCSKCKKKYVELKRDVK
jgi:hypothetical protein